MQQNVEKVFFETMQTKQQTRVCDSSEWVIRSETIDPHNYFGVTIANGMIGLVSSSNPMKIQSAILNGVYDSYGRGRVSNILKTFNPIDIELELDGERISQNAISNLVQTLDMKEASFITTFDIGHKFSVTHTIRALRHLPYCALTTVKIDAKQDILITPINTIVAPDHLMEIQHFYSEIDRPQINIPLITSCGKSPSKKHVLAVSNSFIFLEPNGHQPRLIHENWSHNKHSVKFHKYLKAGESYHFHIISSFTSTQHYSDPLNEAERLSLFAALESPEHLIRRHQVSWDNLWESDILIEGAPQVQKDVRLALYHLYSFVREEFAYSLPPMGLSGTGYNGHIFWDTEMWMFPALVVLHPKMAKSILEYRFERLEAAKQNAIAHGYRGAMFPWESAENGMEETPVWALTGPLQHHIGGCISWACWKYYQVTKDKKWLLEKGYPLLKEIADFWTSRVERNGFDKYDIKHVIGPNEWQENVDNDAFTNAVAITALRYAVQAAQELNCIPDPEWSVVAQNIPILQFPDGVIKENATYDGEEIKQADVNLLAYPLEFISDSLQIQRDLQFYAPRISSEGPAMGPALLSVIYARLGNVNKAYEMFLQSYSPHKEMPFGVLSEVPLKGSPYFVTAVLKNSVIAVKTLPNLEMLSSSSDHFIQKNTF